MKERERERERESVCFIVLHAWSPLTPAADAADNNSKGTVCLRLH